MFVLNGLMGYHSRDPEVYRAKMLGVAGLFFLVSLVVTWREMKYVVWGQTVEARVMEGPVTIKTTRGLRERTQTTVKYAFFDPELKKDRIEEDRVSREWRANETALEGQAGTLRTATVQFIPGNEDLSRVDGRVQWWALVVFFGSLMAMGTALAVFFKGYYDHQRRVQASAERPSTVSSSSRGAWGPVRR